MKVLLFFALGSDLKEVHEVTSYLNRKGIEAITPILLSESMSDKFYYLCCKSLIYNVDEIWIYGNDRTAHMLHKYADAKGKCVCVMCPDFYMSDFKELMNPNEYIL